MSDQKRTSNTGRKRGADLERGAELVRRVTGDVPEHPVALASWVRRRLGIRVAGRALVRGHGAPMDYLVHSFFEGAFTRDDRGGWTRTHGHRADCVVWANRGGGKTFLGALASLLDMLFKPMIQVRVLAGSLEQGRRMHEHLRRLLRTPDLAPLVHRFGSRRVVLVNGSATEILAASETSIRGTRPQKVRCDEVDLFQPELWRAALLTTRSMNRPGPWGPVVRGGVDALSTMQRPHGLMWELVSSAAARGGRTVHRWGVVDALERCPDERPCAPCPLSAECAGRAKHARAGHIRIDDACELKARVDADTWESEMLCLRPRTTDAVYPAFDPARHIVGEPDAGGPARRVVGHVAGMDFGIRSQTVVLLGSIDEDGLLVIEREHVAAGLRLKEHVAALRRWIEEGCTEVSPGTEGASRGIRWVGIDPAGCARNEQTGISNRRFLQEAGFRVLLRRTTVQAGIRRVSTRLSPADAPDRPRLLIRSRCTRLIEAMQRYHYPTDNLDKTEPVKDGPDHACDALRYLVVNLDGGSGDRVGSYLG
jgi:hypothetical protein